MTIMKKVKLCELCWKYYKYCNSNISVTSVDNTRKEMLEDIYTNIEQFPELKDQLSKKDINIFFNNDDRGSFNYEHAYINDNSSEPIKNNLCLFIDKHIFKNKEEYIFYFRVGTDRDFKNNKKIGHATIRTSDNVPRIVVNDIYSSFQYPIYNSNDGRIYRSKKFSFMEIKIKSIGSERAREKAIQQFNQSYNLYKIMSYVDTYEIANKILPPHVCYKKKNESMTSFDVQEPFRGLVIGTPFYNYIEKINIIMNKSKYTDLEKRILSSIDTYGTIEEYMPKYVKFLLIMISLETLLLSEDDKHNVAEKLTEKIIFLITKNSKMHDNKKLKIKLLNERLDMYKKIKQLYKSRSDLVHGNIITDDLIFERYKFARLVLIESIIALADKSKIYEYMMKKNDHDDKSLDFYFQKLKFKTNI